MKASPREINFLRCDTTHVVDSSLNWNGKIQEMRNIFFWREGEERMIGKRWRTWGRRRRGGEDLDLRFTKLIEWAPPPPSSCRKITYNDGGGTEPMEAQNGYYLRRRRHSWLSFWFTSCPLDLILASTARSTPFSLPPSNDWPFEFSGYDERN